VVIAADSFCPLLSCSTPVIMNQTTNRSAEMSSGSDDLQFDVVIIGAGISGINAAYRIQSELPPNLKYTILEGRETLGGTWDLFKYPGIRSDSDIFTFGFPWSPWQHDEALAKGELIKDYMMESARKEGIDRHIRYQHKVEEANWNSQESKWELKVTIAGVQEPVAFKARFLLLGTGYYDYETPLEATIPGISNFQGKVIHPQFWPEDYDYQGKNVVIIGSGATAITLLPSMADKARRVTMLQRSPSYIFSLPSSSFVTKALCLLLPLNLAYFINRLVWILGSCLSTLFCKAYPGLAKSVLRRATQRQLPPGVSWDRHFKPKYNPWEQRLCACKNGDFYAALRSGKADVVTGVIAKVTQTSIELETGETLHPDVIITATGLKLRFGGGINFKLDGQAVNLASKFAWKAAMLQDIPNLLFITGYENASWTLGADVSARLFVRITKMMHRRGAASVVPRVSAEATSMETKSLMSLTSTYLRNIRDVLPKAGVGQWSPKSNYVKDMTGARWGDVTTDLYFQ
jgi:cation diffusion facilitator CzcD-associated flavoprotein CzcO